MGHRIPVVPFTAGPTISPAYTQQTKLCDSMDALDDFIKSSFLGYVLGSDNFKFDTITRKTLLHTSWRKE